MAHDTRFVQYFGQHGLRSWIPNPESPKAASNEEVQQSILTAVTDLLDADTESKVVTPKLLEEQGLFSLKRRGSVASFSSAGSYAGVRV